MYKKANIMSVRLLIERKLVQLLDEFLKWLKPRAAK